MSEWKTVRLGDVFDLQMGKTPDRKKLDYFQGSHKWISIADISKSEKYISETKECLSDEAITSSGIKSIPKDTLIMSFKLSIGKTAITSDEMYSNEAIMAFLSNGKCETDNSFLYHLFSNKDWSEGINKAVKGITLNKASLSESKIPLPPLEIQKQIAAQLDKCTALIAKHKLMLEKYDTLIKSRFIEMFGDPVTNPKNWKIIKLADSVTTLPQNGMYKPQSDYVNDLSGIPILRIDGFYKGKISDWDSLKRLTCSDDDINKYHLNEDDIVINRVNSIEYLGKCAHIQGLKETTVYESNMMRMHFDDNRFNPVYVTKLLCSNYIYGQILNIVITKRLCHLRPANRQIKICRSAIFGKSRDFVQIINAGIF